MKLVRGSQSRGVHSVAQQGFGAHMDAYDATRSRYSRSLLRSLARDHSLRGSFLELASGTGLLTRALREHAESLVCVEPSREMRRVFREQLPGVRVLEGEGARMPLVQSASCDALFVGQAFHWMAEERVLREMARVLRDDAPLVLLWNMEDHRVPWVAAMRRVYEAHDSGVPQFRRGLWRRAFEGQALFRHCEERVVRYDDAPLLSLRQIWQRTLSRSYIAVLPEEERERVRLGVLAAIREHLGPLSLDDRIPVPQVATAVVKRKNKE